MRLILAFAAFVLWLSAYPSVISAQSDAVVLAEESFISDTSEGLTVTVSMSGPRPYRVFTMTGPPRLVIDFQTLSLVGLPAEFGQSASEVLGIRHGIFRPGWSRLVVDLAGHFTLRSAEMEGNLLRVDLIPATEDVMAQASHPPTDTMNDAALLAVNGAGKAEKPLIVLDPGHGGEDPGAVAGDIFEKVLVLEVALDLRQRILDTGRYRVALTRETDVFIPLRERVVQAREMGGDLFLSIHANAVQTGYAEGVEIFTLSEEASSVEAAALMEFENRSDIVAGVELEGEDDVITSALIDLAQTDTNAQSLSFAGLLQLTLADELKLRNQPRLMSAGFRVLRAPDIPSALLEMGFLTNSVDRQYMQDPRWQRDFSRAIVAGLDRWFELEAEREAQFRK